MAKSVLRKERSVTQSAPVRERAMGRLPTPSFTEKSGHGAQKGVESIKARGRAKYATPGLWKTPEIVGFKDYRQSSDHRGEAGPARYAETGCSQGETTPIQRSKAPRRK